MPLTPDQTDRYKRHILLPEIGGQGQQALLGARVLVVGAGALGGPVLAALAGAGVGFIGICDGDRVEASNLHRQTLFRLEDIGQPKATSAARRLSGLNPDTSFDIHDHYFVEVDGERLCRTYDLIVEGVDRYAPRFDVNAVCLSLDKPLISAGVRRFDGQVAGLWPGQTSGGRDLPCYACLVPEAPHDEAVCETEGVLGPLTGIVGNMAALAALRLLAGDQTVLGQLTLFDGLAGTARTVRLPRDPGCAVCQKTA